MKPTWNAQETIDRYVYDVVRRLPTNQQEEIKAELDTLIEDMLDARDLEGKRDRQHVEYVLYELGKPSFLATQYLAQPRYLIGPAYYDEYLFLLRLVVPIVVIVILGVGIWQVIGQPQKIFGLLGSMVDAGVHAFAWVTLVMVLNSYFGSKTQENNEWRIDDLPQVPDNSIIIKKTEPVVTIIFLWIGLIIWLFYSQHIGIYLFLEEMTFVSVFDNQIVANTKFMVVIVIGLDILVEIFHLWEGKRTMRLMIATLFIKTISLAGSLWVLRIPGLFTGAVQELLDTSLAYVGFTNPFSLATIVCTFVVLVYVGEICSVGYRMWKTRITRR